MSKQPTPRPWIIERHDQDDGSINYEIWAQQAPVYHRVVTMNDWDNEAARSDSALIAKAVNERDDLLRALQQVRSAWDGPSGMGTMYDMQRAMSAVRSALAKAAAP